MKEERKKERKTLRGDLGSFCSWSELFANTNVASRIGVREMSNPPTYIKGRGAPGSTRHEVAYLKQKGYK